MEQLSKRAYNIICFALVGCFGFALGYYYQGYNVYASFFTMDKQMMEQLNGKDIKHDKK